jgi:signal transduction histidine kinase
MSWSMRFLTFSRPLTLVACMIVFVIDPRITTASLALYVVSAAFFVASSAIINDWIQADYNWQFWTLWAEIALITYLNWHSLVHYNSNAATATFMVITVSIPLTLSRQHWRPAFVVTIAGWLLTTMMGTRAYADWNQAFFVTLIFAGAMIFFASTGVLMINLREEKARSERLLKEVTDSRAALERAHRQLQESAASQQQVAVVEERQRLAREIHDSVAHGLTALVVQTQAARRLLARDPEKAAETIARCEEMAREALQETRRAVRALHPSGLEQVTDLEALQRLARDYGIATGMEIEVRADEGALALPPDHHRLEQLYRIFQEALTNAHRHGGATVVTARLSATPAELTFSVTNNGTPPANMDPGVGLKSMAERARSIGGSITFAPGPVGLAIHITVPLTQEVAG